MVLAKAHENRKQLAEKEVYLLPALLKEDSIKGILCLKKRREIIDDGVPEEKMEVGNVELSSDGEKWRYNQAKEGMRD